MGWGGLGFRVYDLGVIGLRISGWGGEVRVQGAEVPNIRRNNFFDSTEPQGGVYTYRFARVSQCETSGTLGCADSDFFWSLRVKGLALLRSGRRALRPPNTFYCCIETEYQK